MRSANGADVAQGPASSRECPTMGAVAAVGPVPRAVPRGGVRSYCHAHMPACMRVGKNAKRHTGRRTATPMQLWLPSPADLRRHGNAQRRRASLSTRVRRHSWVLQVRTTRLPHSPFPLHGSSSEPVDAGTHAGMHAGMHACWQEWKKPESGARGIAGRVSGRPAKGGGRCVWDAAPNLGDTGESTDSCENVRR
jgi:hypothetical protein